MNPGYNAQGQFGIEGIPPQPPSRIHRTTGMCAACRKTSPLETLNPAAMALIRADSAWVSMVWRLLPSRSVHLTT